MKHQAPTVEALPRDKVGSIYARRLRKAGRLPAVIYGHKKEPVAISVDESEMLMHLRHGTHVLTIDVEGAKQEMGIPQAIEETVTAARDAYLADHSASQLHHLSADLAALWPKIDHLTYLPILGLKRTRDLYYYQGEGLCSVYGYTYKYLTLEHFLGQLTRVQVGASLAERLAHTYVQAWYPAHSPLTIFADWHIKPHWTKTYSHTGHVTMWGRTMPAMSK